MNWIWRALAKYRTTFKNGPLHQAKSAADVERWLRRGLSVDEPGWMGATPLHAAAQSGLMEVVDALIQAGADVHARRPERDDTPLHFASAEKIAQSLIEHGADLHSKDCFGQTPLHWSSRSGYLSVVQILIDNGARVIETDQAGKTPLHLAAVKGHDDVVQFLLSHGADIIAQDANGKTPLHEGARRGHLETARLLLSMGADLQQRDKSGCTSIHAAELNGQVEVAADLAAMEHDHAPAGIPQRMTALTIQKLRLHPHREECFSIAVGAILSRWDIRDHPVILRIAQSEVAWYGDFAVLADGEMVALTTHRNTVQFRSTTDLSLIEELKVHVEEGGSVTAIAASADGHWLAVADTMERVHILDRHSQQEPKIVSGGELTASLCFHPHHERLAVACSFQGGASVVVYQRRSNETWERCHELERSDCSTQDSRFTDTLTSVTFSPNGKLLALFETSRIYHEHRPQGWRGDVVLYEVESGKLLWQTSIDATATGDARSLKESGHVNGFITEVVFLDDETVACGSTNGWILFLRVQDGSIGSKTRVHPTGAVVSLAVDSTNRKLWAAVDEESAPIFVEAL